MGFPSRGACVVLACLVGTGAGCGGATKGGEPREAVSASGGAGVDEGSGGSSEAGGRPGGSGGSGRAGSAGAGGAGAGGVAAGGTGGAPPFLACPDVFAGPPPPDPGRSDAGVEGLAALRARVWASRARFIEYDDRHGESYRYTRQSNYLGGFCETTLEIESGVAVARRQEGQESWVETGGEIATHEGCHPIRTMLALYDDCLNEVLCQDPRENWIYVHIDARGLLAQCGYVPMSCADDCYVGLEPLILTVDGSDWTEVPEACCPISPEPDCCMHYGGTSPTGRCLGMVCDGIPTPSPGWTIAFTPGGCPYWQGPADPGPGCCGCP